jgi:alpha-tubulin suppressor-like RCC1 family protein
LWFPLWRIAAGEAYSCAWVSDGTVKCWGENNVGQLGDGTTTNRRTPVPVVGLSGVHAVVGGGSYVFAMLVDGTVKAWGYNYAGQDPNTSNPVGFIGYGDVGGGRVIRGGSWLSQDPKDLCSGCTTWFGDRHSIAGFRCAR